MSHEGSGKTRESKSRIAGDVTGKLYNGRFYERHPTEPATYLCDGKEYKYYWSDIAEMPLMVRKDIGADNAEEAIAAEAKEAKGLTDRDGDINQYATLGWARVSDLERLDGPSLKILDDGIRSIRKRIIDSDTSSSDWTRTEIHPLLLALFHRLDIRYNDGSGDMGQYPGWARYINIKLLADERIRGILSCRRGRCNEMGDWATTAALDTLVEISRWRNID